MNRQLLLRRIAPIGAALALGGGAGAAIYATTTGPANTTATVVASVPAQQAAQTVASTSDTLTQLYKNTAPGVVDITVVTGSAAPSFTPGGGQSSAEGSGFVIDTKGDIVTNAHVVDGATSIKVRFQNGKTAKATLVGSDDSTDIAVIKVSTDASQLHPLSWGVSKTVQVGESVAAIGSPFGLPESMSAGIISAVGRTITAPNNYSISGALQTDAAINHGNSGGPLLDLRGEVIGITSQIQSEGGGNDGVGFAVPSNTVKSIAAQLIANGKAEHALLGVTPVDTANGVRIATVKSGSAADDAGLKEGDVITAVGATQITSSAQIRAIIAGKQPGDGLTLTVRRDGSSKTVQVTLGTRS